MLSTLAVVLPIFALIFTGWLARRSGMLGPQSTSELNRFVVYLALPALLFDIIAHTHWAQIWQPAFIAVFGLSSFSVFAFTVVARLKRPRHLADAAIDGLNAGYANAGFIGIPLAAVALGKDALAPTTVATLMTVCLLFAVAIVLIETGLQQEKRRAHLFIKVVRALAKNPLLIAPILGTIIPMSGLTIPDPVETFLKLLGGAASPCALVALGLFLAEKPQAREDGQGRDLASTAVLVTLKLVAQPLIAWLLGVFVIKLPPSLLHTAVLLAALPTGTGPFMLAEFYGREAKITSDSILISTALSVITLSAYLAFAT
jgi:malonate transporter and related proteins